MELSKVSKAVAGALAAIFASILVKYGFDLAPEVSEAINVLIEVLVTAVIGFVVVYWAPKNKG